MVRGRGSRDHLPAALFELTDDGREAISALFARHTEDIETVMGVLSARRAAAPLAGAQENRHSSRAPPTCSIQGSARRLGALAVAASHGVHHRTRRRTGASQGPRGPDGVVAVPIQPSVQVVDGRISSPLADEPPHSRSAGNAEGREAATGRHCARDGFRGAESLLACLQGSRRRAARRMAASAPPVVAAADHPVGLPSSLPAAFVNKRLKPSRPAVPVGLDSVV